ncbi:hypothetical protein QYE76_070957 [Lolium multiflorum]|uniref:Retrotransposon gag domain-containing protein n=1 Tax=Lolium multiflorum TaxID=4521 RepID=A0AAD8SJ56_LOLMU|nr:hypothetical protein QYE76_070957 [Lolium multiflorum]
MVSITTGDIPTSLLPLSLQAEDEPAVKLKSNEGRIGPITRARAKLLKQQVNLFLNDTLIDESFILPKSYYLCIIGVSRGDEHTRGEEQDVKTDVKLDKELDMKISHGLREERGGRRERRRKFRPVQRPVRPAPRWAAVMTWSTGATGNRFLVRLTLLSPGANRTLFTRDIITWREYEALRNEMRREFRTKDDELKDDDEDPELEDDAHNARGAPRGHRPRGRVPLGRNGHKMKKMDWVSLSFPYPSLKEELMLKNTSLELKIEKLWSLHPHYSEDRKIKLASSEFDGYALRWWDSLVRNLDEDGAQPIRTWRAMKEAMTSRFVPTNYMRNIFDKLTLLRQGVKTVDEYYMEMEMLMQRGRVRESLEMTMQRFLNGLKYDVKGIVRHYTYTNMNQLLHHAREAESQLAEEAKVKGRATGSWAFYTPCALYSAFDALRSLLYSA